VTVKDWDAASAAMSARMAELDVTQAEVAGRAGVALMTVRELQHNLQPRRRSPRTLAALSEALGWPAGHLERLASGGEPGEADAGMAEELRLLRAEVARLAARVEALEGKVSGP
jgi:transcriptional regulator with XRE-family HTH domain